MLKHEPEILVEYTTEIPTRLGYKGLIDHASVYKDCYPKDCSHRTYKYKNAGTWCMTVYYEKGKNWIKDLELNTFYYDKTETYIKAQKILEEYGPLTKEELFKKLVK